MGLFDKIKTAINDSGVVDSAKQKAKDLMQNQDNGKTNDVTQNASLGNAEPELAQFYKLYAESVKSKKPEVAKEKGIAAISEFIDVYTPSLNFLSDSIKESIWRYTKYVGIPCNYQPKNAEDKNVQLHFIYAMKDLNGIEDFEEKVLYLWKRYNEEFDPTLDNDMLYTYDVFGKSLKKFKLTIDYFPSNRKVNDETLFQRGSCEHGDCIVCKDDSIGDERLFCTCDQSACCDKKEDYCSGNLADNGLLPAIKARAFGMKNKKDGYNIKAAEVVLDTYAPSMKNRKIVEMMAKSIDCFGVNESRIVRYFVMLHKLNFEFKIERILEYIKVLEMLDKEYGLEVEQAEWLANHTLYTKEELTYITRVLLSFSNEKWVQKHLIDTSVVNLSEFVDENGCIKDAGTDGREGDTIYNVVEKWCNGNENEEVFAEEKEQRRRLKICNNCARSTYCKTKGLLENCSGYIPK